MLNNNVSTDEQKHKRNLNFLIGKFYRTLSVHKRKQRNFSHKKLKWGGYQIEENQTYRSEVYNKQEGEGGLKLRC